MTTFKNQIAIRNFEIEKFDGGARESFQFVKFFKLKIDEAGISSILSLVLQPNVELSLDVLYTRGEHNLAVETTRRKFHKTTEDWQDIRDKWHEDHNNILMDGTKDTAAKETAWLSMGPCPERPVWKTPTTDFTPHMAALISHHEKDKRYQDSNASKAMAMLQSYCTPRLNEFCSKGVYDVEDVPPREKLLHLWSWIKQLQIADRTVIGQVKDDMRNLLPITTFQEAISNIAAMDLLQSELTTMGEPYSDENLISLHSSKLANTDSFKALKKQFLLSEHHLRLAWRVSGKPFSLQTHPDQDTHGSATVSRSRRGID